MIIINQSAGGMENNSFFDRYLNTNNIQSHAGAFESVQRAWFTCRDSYGALRRRGLTPSGPKIRQERSNYDIFCVKSDCLRTSSPLLSHESNLLLSSAMVDSAKRRKLLHSLHVNWDCCSPIQ